MKIFLSQSNPKDYRTAVAIQEKLRPKIVIRPIPAPVKMVAGADVSYDKATDRVFAAVILMTLPRLEIIEMQTCVDKAAFPYIPGLLTFREAPPLLRAFAKIKNEPDVVIIDGQGIAHMRGIGIASHIGLSLRVPTVGCAKSRLVGEHNDVEHIRGRRVPLRYDGRVVGSVLCTRDGTKPLYVSPGHLADIPSSVRLILRCTRGYRVPEPIRAAHYLVNQLRTNWTP